MPDRSAKPLNIGFVIDTNLDSADGVQQYVKAVGAWMSVRGHNVQYLTSTSSIDSWQKGSIHSLSGSVNVTFNGNRVTMPTLARKKRIRHVLQNTSFDILHVQMPYSPLLAQRVIKAASKRTAIIGTFHIVPYGKLQTVGSRLLKTATSRSLKRFTAITSVSSAAEAFALKTFKIKSVIIPNPVNVAAYSGAQPMPKSKTYPKRIVFLGRLVPRKGASLLLDAFIKLAAQRDDVELVMAGDGALRTELEAKIKQHGLGGRVTLLGFIDESAKPQLLASADIACFPSVSGESFGIVLIEAMAAGARIVLGGDNVGYRTVLGEHPKLLIDPRQTAAFSQRLNELLDETPQTRALHTWQTEAVKQYDINTVGSQLESLYYQSIAKIDTKYDTKT